MIIAYISQPIILCANRFSRVGSAKGVWGRDAPKTPSPDEPPKAARRDVGVLYELICTTCPESRENLLA